MCNLCVWDRDGQTEGELCVSLTVHIRKQRYHQPQNVFDVAVYRPKSRALRESDITSRHLANEKKKTDPTTHCIACACSKREANKPTKKRTKTDASISSRAASSRVARVHPRRRRGSSSGGQATAAVGGRHLHRRLRARPGPGRIRRARGERLPGASANAANAVVIAAVPGATAVPNRESYRPTAAAPAPGAGVNAVAGHGGVDTGGHDGGGTRRSRPRRSRTHGRSGCVLGLLPVAVTGGGRVGTGHGAGAGARGEALLERRAVETAWRGAEGAGVAGGAGRANV